MLCSMHGIRNVKTAICGGGKRLLRLALLLTFRSCIKDAIEKVS